MFEKARVETVLYSKTGLKSEQISNWNDKFYKKIVRHLDEKIKNIYKTKNNYTENQKSIILSNLKKRYFEKIPDNALIVSFINNKNNNQEKYSLCYPFFSSHVMLPIKPGEVVWVYKYQNEEADRRNKISTLQYEAEFNFNKSYWLSRVHGESFSEDLNYTNFDREFIPPILLESANQFANLDYIDNSKSAGFKPLKNLIGDYVDKNQNLYFGPTLKTQKNPGDLVIQGSNNNAIMFTGKENNSGDITLVSGKGKLTTKERQFNDFGTDTNRKKVEISTSLSKSNLSNIKKVEVYTSSKKKQVKKIEENFKYPQYYSENILTPPALINNVNEGNLDLNNDASIFQISDFLSKNHFTKLFDVSQLDKQNFYDDSLNSNIIQSEPIKIGDKEFTIKNQSPAIMKNNFEIPAIVMKSNNIAIISREEKPAANSGNIFIVNNGTSLQNYSHITLNKNGNVNIDGAKITIGGDHRPNNPESGSIFLSPSSTMEPLVKGDHLVAALESLIKNIQDAFTSISFAMDELTNHVHPHPMGPTSPKQIVPPLGDSTDAARKDLGDDSQIQNQLKAISDNLNNLLSKIVRTS